MWRLSAVVNWILQASQTLPPCFPLLCDSSYSHFNIRYRNVVLFHFVFHSQSRRRLSSVQNTGRRSDDWQCQDQFWQLQTRRAWNCCRESKSWSLPDLWRLQQESKIIKLIPMHSWWAWLMGGGWWGGSFTPSPSNSSTHWVMDGQMT